MKSYIVVIAALMTTQPAWALPEAMIGKWSTEKNKCKNEELLYRITQKTINSYESACKISKINIVDVYTGNDYNVSLTCDAEGSIIKSSILLVQQDKDQIKYVLPKWKNQHAWMFRCKK
jgi:hypothetical protein